MRPSTIILAAVVLVLAALTGTISWQLITHRSAAPTVSSAVAFGVPDVRPNEPEPAFQARSALLYDATTQTIKFEQNGFERVPIASLTKLMTAMVALDYGIDWDHLTTIHLAEYLHGTRLLVHPGEELTMHDLFMASLLGSANNATKAYVRELGIAEEEFIREMNRKAIALGLEQTAFTEPTGLDEGNISTAYEIARLTSYALANYPEIAAATSQAEYTITFAGSGRTHTMRNSNKLISEDHQTYAGSKTGYTYEAGYCLVVQGVGPTQGRIAVLLGSPSEPRHFADIQRLLNLQVP